ncbi:MAG: allophanate hydrolase, partial [Alphaproteobacteria bacterium]
LLYDGPWVAERYAAIRDVVENRPETLHPTTRGIVEQARKFSAADAFDAAYRLADLRRAVAPAIEDVDLLCVPSIPTFYSRADLEADPIGPNARLGTYTNFVNLLDLCGLAVPTASRSDGRPGGVTLLGRWGRDSLLAAVGAALHRDAGVSLGATGWPLPPASAPAADLAGAGEIAVVLVGAHMQGLPLNHEVAGRGGRFLKATETAPRYRLYSLAGGPPKRPGMIRGEDGAAIAVEVWALPLEAFGAFMTGIPQPLGIGTIDLADGGQAKGFLCEPAGLDGAEEITAFGGWRAYLASL